MTGTFEPADEAAVPGVSGAASRNELSGTVVGPSVQARSIAGDVNINVQRRVWFSTPRQLLPGPPHFAARRDDVSSLYRLVESGGTPVRLIVVFGLPGVGKTSLALHWLNRVSDQFPDGQLYASLGGGRGGDPVSPGDELERFLRGLGTPPEHVPPDLPGRARLYRSLTTGKRLAVLLDDAWSAAQVRPLLPGEGPALTLVTTRWRLGGLVVSGARFIELEPLDEDGAVELLDRILGAERTEGEEAATRRIARLCAGLPIALCACAARLSTRPSWPIQRVAAELAEERRRLSRLEIEGDISVRSVFDLSYQYLPEPVARLYRLLALVPGPTLPLDVAAAAADLGESEAEAMLDELVGASLLEEVALGRFRFHDLVRLHARAEAERSHPPAERLDVLVRVTDRYLDEAVRADYAAMPGRWRLGPRYAAHRDVPVDVAVAGEALDRIEAELPNLMAVVRAAYEQGLYPHVWQLCEALWSLFLYRKHYQQWQAAHRLGVAAAEVLGDTRAQARMLVQLGFAHRELGDLDVAERCYRDALDLDETAGHPLGVATALEHLGHVALSHGQVESALERFVRALSIHQEAGEVRGVALMTRRIGEVHRDAGRPAEAIDWFERAARLHVEMGDRFNAARALTGLAQSLVLLGRADEARGHLEHARAAVRAQGSRYEEARIGVVLADIAEQRGDVLAAIEHLRAALEIYGELAVPEEEQVRQRLRALQD